MRSLDIFFGKKVPKLPSHDLRTKDAVQKAAEAA